MHHRADVVGHQVVGAVLVELSHVAAQVLPQHLDGAVPVRPLLLVPQAQRVADLVHDRAELQHRPDAVSVAY